MNVFAFMPPQGGGDSSQLVSTLVMFGGMIAVFYFFIIRPQSKRQKEAQKMLESLKQGDKVVLSSGIHGSVTAVEDKVATVQIADNVKIRVDKTAVTTVVPKQ